MTEEDGNNSRAYFEALGKFVHAFAGVETCLAMLLKLCLDEKAFIASELLHNARVSDTIKCLASFFKRQESEVFWKIPPEKREWFLMSFRQVETIAKYRNTLLHNPATVLEGKITTLEWKSILVQKPAKRKNVTIQKFIFMAEDLEKIKVLTEYVIAMKYATITIGPNNSGFQAVSDQIEAAFASPFQYNTGHSHQNRAHASNMPE